MSDFACKFNQKKTQFSALWIKRKKKIKVSKDFLSRFVYVSGLTDPLKIVKIRLFFDISQIKIEQ